MIARAEASEVLQRLKVSMPGSAPTVNQLLADLTKSGGGAQ